MGFLYCDLGGVEEFRWARLICFENEDGRRLGCVGLVT